MAKKAGRGKKGKIKKMSLAERMEKSGRSKLAELKALAKEVNKALGKTGAVYTGDQQREFVRKSTGIAALDYVLGGGLICGQMVQFTGEDSSGKTTAALICAATAQKRGDTVLWLAGEGFDKKWAVKWGVNLEDLLLITADTGDTALEAAVTMMQSGLVDVLVLDSLQSLGTTREIESGIDDEAYAGAGAPQMWGKVMRKSFAAMNAGADTAIIGISQVRAPIGKYGVTEPQGSGIYALKHWKAADVYFRKGELDYTGSADETRRMLGREFKLRCLKNKAADAVERQASFWLRYRKDRSPCIDNVGSLFRLAKSYGLIEMNGSWVEGYGIRAQGAEKYIKILKKDKQALELIALDLQEET